MKRIFNVFGNVLLTFLVILLIGYGWAFFEMKIMLKSHPEMFGYVFYKQNTDDMIPDFDKNDVLIIKKNATYNKGDRVLYLTSDSEYKIHTVVAVDSISTTTTCNTCITNNKPIDNSTVIGRVVAKIFFLGNFINFFKQKWVLVSTAVLGFLFVIMSQFLGEKPVKKVASNK